MIKRDAILKLAQDKRLTHPSFFKGAYIEMNRSGVVSYIDSNGSHRYILLNMPNDNRWKAVEEKKPERMGIEELKVMVKQGVEFHVEGTNYFNPHIKICADGEIFIEGIAFSRFSHCVLNGKKHNFDKVKECTE